MLIGEKYTVCIYRGLNHVDSEKSIETVCLNHVDLG